MIRNPIVAGQFYPQTKESLKKMLSRLIGECSDRQEAKGVIMPHAGYIYSGYVAGHTISRIEIKKTVIILGVNHTGKGSRFGIMTRGSWLTPLGEVKIDTEIAEAISGESCLIKNDIESHVLEHSIEVQLPFLQYLRKDVKIVPIALSHGDLEEYRRISDAITNGIRKIGRSAMLLSSTDFTHYEPKDIAEEKDGYAISAILSLDENKLLSEVKNRKISMCGAAPTCVTLRTCKNMGASKAGLVKYQTSGDVSGDYDSVVGYAGLIIC